ncbi:MAG: GNAT family N-acetyltransferase [Roseibium sp.]|nr:GNAT family N-acetyltransferase [Roseibium sp.]
MADQTPRGKAAESRCDPRAHTYDVQEILPEEYGLFLSHLLRLDARTREDRFGMAASDQFLRQYVETTRAVGTLVLVSIEAGQVRASAELRPVPDPDAAEATVCVEPAWRGRGIATRLMSQIVDEAKSRGVRRLYVRCLATNAAMRSLAAKFTPHLVLDATDVTGRIDAVRWRVRHPLHALVRRVLVGARAALSARA